MNTIHVFLGTKAQYIKTAPLLRLLDRKGIDYRLIDSGQHARLSAGMRHELDVRAPDVVLGGNEDVTSIGGALVWAFRIALRVWSSRRLRHAIFGGHRGVCVVHGDTPSTLLSALLARRAGLRVAHLEAGLRSHSLLHPFPEELIRLVVMRVADLLFAPDSVAVGNLKRMRVRGRVVPLPGNTVVEALHHSLAKPVAAQGAAVVTMHRVENLTRRRRVQALVRVVEQVAARMPVVLVAHGPTQATLRRAGLEARLRAAGVGIIPLVPHHEFIDLLAAARLVITDGGSIQEECALLGVPTLLWRDRTEREDGLDANVVLARYDPETVTRFVVFPERYRHPPADIDTRPSELILEELLALLEPGAPQPTARIDAAPPS